MPSPKSPEQRGYIAVRIKSDALQALDSYCAKRSLSRSDALSLLARSTPSIQEVCSTPEPLDKTPQNRVSVCYTPTWEQLKQAMKEDMCADSFIARVKGCWDKASAL